MTTTQPALTRTERAGAWLTVHAGTNPFLQSLLRQFERYGTLSERQLEAVERNIERGSRPVNPNPVTEIGVYVDADGAIFRVKRSRQNGALYAMRFFPQAHTRASRFVYARGAIARLTADQRITLEKAQEIGIQFGICCVCGATLTAEQSVASGIGPVCASRI